MNIARDSPKKLLEFKSAHNITLPIFGDKSGAIVKAYNVYQTAKLSDSLYLKFRLAIPSTFLIDRKSQIVWAYIGTREDRPSSDLIFQAIDKNLKRV